MANEIILLKGLRDAKLSSMECRLEDEERQLHLLGSIRNQVRRLGKS